MLPLAALTGAWAHTWPTPALMGPTAQRPTAFTRLLSFAALHTAPEGLRRCRDEGRLTCGYPKWSRAQSLDHSLLTRFVSVTLLKRIRRSGQ